MTNIKFDLHNFLCDLQEMAKPLLIYFREERQFDRQLWMNYFTLGVAFLSQPDLQLERMGELARHRAQERFGDMRMKMAFQILSLWSHLGELKQNFIPGGWKLKEGGREGGISHWGTVSLFASFRCGGYEGGKVRLKFRQLPLMSVRWYDSQEVWLFKGTRSFFRSIPWPPFIGIVNWEQWEVVTTDDGFCRVTTRI